MLHRLMLHDGEKNSSKSHQVISSRLLFKTTIKDA